MASTASASAPPPAGTSPSASSSPSSPARTKVNLTGTQGTLCAVLWARAADHALLARGREPILGDAFAARLVGRIDYDFAKFGMQSAQIAAVAYRARVIDEWVLEFLRERLGLEGKKKKEALAAGAGAEGEGVRSEVSKTAPEPDAGPAGDDSSAAGKGGVVVLHLACGLDERYRRVMAALEAENGGDTSWERRVTWVDVDLPDVVAVRKTLGIDPASPAAAAATATTETTAAAEEEALPPWPKCDYSLVAADVTEAGADGGPAPWLAALPADRPVLLVIEGLLVYLTEDKIKAMLRRIVAHFSPPPSQPPSLSTTPAPPRGVVVFDATSSKMLWVQGWVGQVRKAGVRFTWGLPGDDRALEGWTDPPMRLKDARPWVEMAKLPQLDLKDAWGFWLMMQLPFLRNVGKIMRYEF